MKQIPLLILTCYATIGLLLSVYDSWQIHGTLGMLCGEQDGRDLRATIQNLAWPMRIFR